MRIAAEALIAVGIAAVLILTVMAWRNKRRLDRRVAEFLKEQEESSVPINPYAAMAELYAEDERKNQDSRLKKKGRA